MSTVSRRNKPPDLEKRVNICSWNVRGIKDSLKKQVIFSIAKKGNIKILCLQETHLVKETINTLGNKQFRIQFIPLTHPTQEG